MAKQIRTAKINIPTCMAIILFCLTLISFHLASGLYARYISTESGEDDARVITFGDLTLTETGDFYEADKLMIIPGVDLTKKATVDFSGSESATYIFVEVIPTSWQVSGDGKSFSVSVNGNKVMQWSIANHWYFLKSDNGTYVYYREVAPNTAVNDMDIIADEGKITVSEQITKSEITSMTNISIKLRATVVQSIGFETPDAAWSSVSAKE